MVDIVHKQNAALAKRLYLDNLDAGSEADDWHRASRSARRLVANALRESSYLGDIAGALKKDGGHMLAFRHLMAPPKSQDQFKLRCPDWSKGTENNKRPLKEDIADEVAAILVDWLDPAVGHWLGTNRRPTTREVRETLLRTAPLIAHKQVETQQRMRLANAQESAVMALLEARGWTRLQSTLIDTRAAVPPRHFMHKTRFATNTTAPQEVDIACGLRDSFVAAVECKVTNDETNSVKRVNDVLKKATAWKTHWGSFVETAAVLQGVIKASDVQRLADGRVQVFWSHALEDFGTWLDSRV